MPTVRLLEQSPLPPPRRRVTAPERAQAADQLRRACESGKVIELTLDPEERAVLKKAGTETKIVPFESGYSTSQLIEKLKAAK